MKREHFLRNLVLLFLVTLAAYALVFGWIGHRRVAKGPWVVTFTTEAGIPTVIVNQPALDIRDVRIAFPDEPPATNSTAQMEFSQARPVPFVVPFGKCVFLDPLFLPGTVALQLFNHEIQLLPRVLTIDRVERPWQSGERIELRATKPDAAPP